MSTENKSSLPKWMEELKIGNNAGLAYEALTIAVEVLEWIKVGNSYTRHSGMDSGNVSASRDALRLKAEEALRRIEEIGK